MKLKTLLYTAMFVLCGTFLSAQVTSVNYQMKYDTSECRYDCYIIINAGSATTISERIQFNSQYSIIVPTGTTISVDSSYFPIVGNATYSDTDAAEWTISSTILSPGAQPESDFYSIVPPLTPLARYNDLQSGDTVKVFSISVDTVKNCSTGIRLYENGVDPASDATGMQGSDFTNGFTIGGSIQRYNANSTQIFPPVPLIVSATNSCGSGIEIDLTATTSSCQTPLTYQWTGPNSYSSTTEDVAVNPSTIADAGIYKVVITDDFGCKDSIDVVAVTKPDAGADQEHCAGTTQTMSAIPAGGVWFDDGMGNPIGAVLSSLSGGAASVAFATSAGGTYQFRYELDGCTDTMSIVINALPIVSISGGAGICIGNTTTLTSNEVGTWVSNDTNIATVDANTGVVTGIAQGFVTFTFTSTATSCASTTAQVTVNPPPAVTNTGSATLCIGANTLLTPGTGGTWSTTDALVATITNAGLVTAIAEGTAKMVFTETATSCYSDTIEITVTPKPVASLSDTQICVNAQSTLTPTTGGTWASSAPLIATVSNSGVVTALTPGKVVFIFTSSSSTCASDPTDSLEVTPAPVVSFAGDDRLCIDATSSLSPSTGGTWVSNHPLVATVTSSGAITAVGAGFATFTFTNSTTLCTATTGSLIVDPKPTVSSGLADVCINGTTDLSPASGGTWVAVNPTIASIAGNTVTGVSSGTAAFLFTEDGTSCVSDTLFIGVEPGPVVSITGGDDICIGFTTTLSPTTGGIWTSSSPSIASVNNFGVVTGIDAGTVTFTFTSLSTLCSSLPTAPVTIRARPIVDIVGSNAICIGETTTLSPSTGGTWVSSNDAVATVSNSGVVTGVAPGSATFTFTNSTTTCVSVATTPITVNTKPDVSFTGPSEVCIGLTTQLSPTTGGTWESSDEAIATVTNAGLVTAVAAGAVTFTFTTTLTSCASDGLDATINPDPVVSITGATELCIGETSTLSPTTSGTWTSNDPSIATVTNAGVVTAVAQGTTTFYFTDDKGCTSVGTNPITVNEIPTVNITGGDELCIGGTTTLTPSTGGTWVSSDPSIATITSSGVVTGVAAGSVTFIFTNTATTCVSSASDPITVSATPATVLGTSNICVGKTSSITPSVGGTWSSSDPSIATITNDGTITAVAPGKVAFTFVDGTSFCPSDVSDSLTVEPGPTVSISGTDEICIGETAQLLPISGGTWVSLDPSIATVTNSGVVTGLAAGAVKFEYTETATGCKSLPTDAITVHGKPTVTVSGSAIICIGGTTTLSPNTGGTWVSSDPSIATVNASTGEVTGVADGTATFTFTLTATGCTSDDSDPVVVSPTPTASIIGLTNICVGAETTLSPSTGGTWTSSDETVATVTNDGIVTSISPGVVNFLFTETATGCASDASTGDLTITACADPDFNATFVDVPVTGDASTNDGAPVSTTYGPTPVITSTPSGSLHSITINSDGTYTFSGNTVGVYIFEVPVCIPPLVTGCMTSTLTITVVDYLEPDLRPIANVDIATTTTNVDVTLISLENDKCVVVTGCSLDGSSVTIVSGPSRGSATVNPTTGDITYSPGAITGKDTLTYSVCVTGEPANCATAKQIITINSGSAVNSTDATDDFATTQQSVPVSGNVKINDIDPDSGDAQTVVAQNVTVAAGTLSLLSNGDFTFTPADLFYGPVDFPYETCDLSSACANATIHILVVRDLTIKVRVYLEGSLINNGGTKGTSHTRALMRDNLRNNPFTSARYIPSYDIYQTTASPLGTLLNFVDVKANYTHVTPGDSSIFAVISDPTTVFGVSGEDAIVDWVFIELRSKSDSASVVATRSGLVQRDGDVVDLDGINGLRVPGIQIDDYYVSVRHRSHLGAMTAAAQTPYQLTELVDFTTKGTGIFDFGVYGGYDYTDLSQKPEILPGVLALWAGDFDQNGKVKFDNPNDDLNRLFFDVLVYPTNPTGNVNFDFAYGYLHGDYDMNGKSKYDNPNDDKNYLYSTLLFYPLNATGFLSNFDFFIQQLPD